LPDISSNLEVVASHLTVPWSMEFAPDGRLFFTERTGSLKTIKDNKTIVLHKFNVEAKPNDESGLLGLALSPGFKNNHYVYLYFTYSEKNTTWNKVCRYTETDNSLQEMKILLDKIPGGRVHDGGRIKFGPDGKLYITTGETWKRHLAQDPNNLGGKILRINPDGSIPDDNPWRNPVYTIGNRNSQGLAWHPCTGQLYASEHGPSGENGWRAHDEVNKIIAGANYGWPIVIGSPHQKQFMDPVIHTGPLTWAPSGMCFYTGDQFPSLKNKLLIATLRGRHLRVLGFREPEYDKVNVTWSLYKDKIGRIRDVIMGPDGYIYLCTSNRDGRGEPFEGNDFIYRIKSMNR
jgi:glucose/arabinose dehydrogenase